MATNTDTITHIEQLIPAEHLSEESRETNRLRKELDRLCKTNEPRAEIMTITPALARVMLERNKETNRARSRTIAAKYVEEFNKGRMILTNQGIGFDTTGRLVDGQHRLMACLQSGQNFDQIVAFGLSPRSFLYVDSGYKRTPGQKVAMAGFAHGNQLAAAARIVLIYDLMEISLASKSHYSVVARGAISSPPDEFIVDFISETPAFREFTHWYTKYARFPPVSATLFHAAHWLLHVKHPDLADAFIEQLIYGQRLEVTDNVWKLREHLLRAHMNNERVHKGWQLCFIIDAFNDSRRGKTTTFKRVDGRDFPKVLS